MIVSKAILQIILICLITPEIFARQNSMAFDDPVSRNYDIDYSANDDVIFIHTDRDEYVAGEYLWFAAYLVDKQNTPTNTIYIELVNFNNVPIIQKYVSIVNGTGHGAFMIPDTLGTGSYIIRAFTNLMKNFSPEQCFMKAINIYNIFGTRKYTSISINDGAPSHKLPASGFPENMIKVETPDIVKRREKATIDIIIDTAFVSPARETHLSISVSPWTGSDGSLDISDYLTKAGSDTSQWMLKRNMTSDLRYKSEEDGRFIYGRVISEDLNVSPDNKIVLLSVPGKGAFFQYAIPDKEGNFSFKIDDDSFRKDLIFQVAGNPGNDLIRISSSFWDNYADLKKISNTIYSEIPSYIEDW